MKKVVVLDGDCLVYRAAAANESRSIRVTHKQTGQITTHAHRTAFKEHIREVFLIDEFEVEDVQEAEDLSFALHGIKVTIENICKTCNADDYIIYLSGSSNFRDRLPLPTKYKGNRVGNIRPLQLKDCRQYLIHQHNAKLAIDCEADDMLAQMAYLGSKNKEIRYYICTNDKDAYSSDSWLYNWTKMDKPIRIKGLGHLELDDKGKVRGQGRKFLWWQIAAGDPVDFFKPSELSGKKFGDISAYKLLKDLKTDRECVEALIKLYKSWYSPTITYTAWDGVEHTKCPLDMLDMYAACAHMRRWEGDVFEIRKVMANLGIDNG